MRSMLQLFMFYNMKFLPNMPLKCLASMTKNITLFIKNSDLLNKPETLLKYRNDGVI